MTMWIESPDRATGWHVRVQGCGDSFIWGITQNHTANGGKKLNYRIMALPPKMTDSTGPFRNSKHSSLGVYLKRRLAGGSHLIKGALRSINVPELGRSEGARGPISAGPGHLIHSRHSFD